MSQEYFENSKSKTTFVLCGVVIALILIIFISPSTYPDKKNQKLLQEEIIAFQTEFEQPGFPLPTQDIQVSFTSFQTSLYQEGNTLVGFIKSTDKKQTKELKNLIKNYVDTLKDTDEGFVFLSQKTEHFPMLSQILKTNQPSFREVWG